MITNITSSQNPIIKTIYKQTRAIKTDWIIIESNNLLSECLELNLNVKHFLCTQTWYDKHKQLVKKYYQETIIVPQHILEKLSYNQTTQEWMLIVKYQIQPFEIMPASSYFVLDNISDPGNLGTILRNAVAFGFNQLFISKSSVYVLNEKVVRSSMSAILKVQINFYDQLSELVQMLNTQKIKVFASIVDGQSTSLNTIQTYTPSAIILGNETHGIKNLNQLPNVTMISIPISGIESLNVASASAIFMYTWQQLRQACKK